LLVACDGREPPPAPESGALSLRPVAFSDLPGWRQDATAEALPALRATCQAFNSKPALEPIGPQGLAGSAGEWQAICDGLSSLNAAEVGVRLFIEERFVPFTVSSDDDDADGLFTGYYEPELQGSRIRSAAYPAPLYRRPPGLITVAHTRAEVDAGALAGQGLELLWLADPIDAFFLQVQGSGRVTLAEGGSVRVGYAASNGHPYTAIGRVLVDRGEMTKDAATMQTVRQWLRDHPDQAAAVMQTNARYIFFREVEGDGPIGSLGVALTPGRSLAIDASLLPLGAPVWVDTTYPPGTPEAGQPLRRLMVSQDTGSAIKGAVRGDIYWGSGEAALRYAGPMKQQGRYYLLLPKVVAERMAGSP
jgi:membrane-bound lytic murein transglycosylase A